jgi:hypothetical protein
MAAGSIAVVYPTRLTLLALSAWRPCRLALLLLALMTAAAHGQAACVGDCDASAAVTVDELTAMIAVALGVPSPVSCDAGDANRDGSITVDEIVAALTNALQGCSFQELSGTCLVPGDVGLTGCSVGTIVNVFRCETPSCDETARMQIGSTSVQPPPDGGFVVTFDARQAADVRLVLEALVDEAQIYRTIDVGNVGDIGSAATPTARHTIGPTTEAAVRLMAEVGLEQFTDDGIERVIAAAGRAINESSLAGLSPGEAANRATEVARNDPTLKDEIESNRILSPEILVTAAIDPRGDTDPYGFTLERAAGVVLNLAKTGDSSPAVCLRVFALRSNEPIRGGERRCATSTQLPVRMDLSLPGGSYTVLVDGDGVSDYSLLYLQTGN